MSGTGIGCGTGDGTGMGVVFTNEITAACVAIKEVHLPANPTLVIIIAISTAKVKYLIIFFDLYKNFFVVISVS